MSEVREEYTRENYPSFGKKYNDEKAVISMTSWSARISTCSKTIFSLLKQCPGFHIVLVLSEEEFPKMMDELPENLKLFVDNELIEILWVYKNYKSLKKVIFTMDKYQKIPVISADDDCYYVCNYAQELYDKWKETNADYLTYNLAPSGTEGPCTLYSNKVNILPLCKLKMHLSNALINDDIIISKIIKDLNFTKNSVKARYDYPFKFHTTIAALNPSQYRESVYQKCLC